MAMILIAAHLALLLSKSNSWTEASSEPSPRMIITSPETTKNIQLPSSYEPLWVFLGEDQNTVVTAGHKDLVLFNLQDPQMTLERKVPWKGCTNQPDCEVRITLVQKTNDSNHVLLCGTHDTRTECCYMNFLEDSPVCISSKMDGISESIAPIKIKEEDPSVLVESGDSADLYIAHSDVNDLMGLYRFGRNRLDPDDNVEEHHYVSLMYSRRKSDRLQDRVYAFYKEKNKSTDPYSERWTPYVAQVCASDKGGSKQMLQLKWTSLLRARLFCGEAKSKLYFSELVDVAIVEDKLRGDTKVYALFRNEWGISAVCAYTVGDLHNVFMTSRFSGPQSARSRECVADSTAIPLVTLSDIQKTSKLEQWMQPLRFSPLLISKHHNYTHILVDSSVTEDNPQQTLLFLSLNSGRIHKIFHNNSQLFVIAEYRPFEHKRHITGLTLDPPTRKLYVATRDELVQVDVGNCKNYGHTCQECVLSRDPHCGWDGATCSPYKRGMKRDVAQGDIGICAYAARVGRDPTTVHATLDSQVFFRCPVKSHHAQYSWHHGGASTACSVKDQECLLLIDRVGAKHEKVYECLAEESGYKKTVKLYQLKVQSRSAGLSLSPLPWLLLMTLIISTLFSCKISV